jgi:hypothetical protein
MKFFGKLSDSEIRTSGWSYDRKADRPQIREALLFEQFGFCAYTEKVLGPTDGPEIEHYDPRLKSTPDDGYTNWYAVCHRVNQIKPKKLDARFLPIIERPHETDLASRIQYVGDKGCFEPLDPDDVEAQNFLRFICVNETELVKERMAHVGRILDGFDAHHRDFAAFSRVLLNDKKLLSFISALETALGVELSETALSARYP